MYCSTCGRQQPDDANFCQACGQKLSVSPPTDPASAKSNIQGEHTQQEKVVVAPKPRRLILMAIWNMLSGLLAIAAIPAVFSNPDVTSRLGWGTSNLLIGAFLAAFLVVACFLALLGRRRGNLLMLAAAILFFSVLIYQNASLIGQVATLMPNGGEGKVLANIFRSSLQLAFTAWATLSGKTRNHFSQLSAAGV